MLGSLYLSKEVAAHQIPGGGFQLARAEAPDVVLVNCTAKRQTNAWAIMLELTEEERLALGLPACEAVTGGTALCLARADKAATGVVPTPSAPTCWDELVSAELWPMGWLGAEDGIEMKIVLPDEQ